MRHNFAQCLPSGSCRSIEGQRHMDSEQSALSEGASSKAIGAAGSEPAMCPFMVDMRVNPESYQKIAVQEQVIPHASSDSIR